MTTETTKPSKTKLIRENVIEPTRHCIQRGPAECILKTKDALLGVGERLAQTLGQVVREVKECGTSLPNLASSVGKNAKASADDIIDSIRRVSQALNQAAPYGGPSLFKPVRTVILLYIQNLQDKLNTALLGDKAAMAQNLDLDKLSTQIRQTSERYKQLVMSPQFKVLFRDVTDNYSKGLVESLNVAQPSIDRISDKFTDMMKDVGDKAGTALGDALLNVLKSVIAEVPLLGGIVDLLISIGELVNKLVSTCKPPLNFAAEVGLPLVNKSADEIEKLKCEWIKLSDQTSSMMKKLDVAVPAVKKGGGTKHRPRRRHQRRHMTRRSRR
jgi:hypothetical protein